jgi:DNA mismatch endonuclease (patch repair protein)
MTDVFSPEKRKEVMRLIKSKNSKAELIVFKYLRSQKVYFQKHYKGAPGTPDIALPRKKKAVFIDGDFWHGKRLQETIERRGVNDYWTIKVMKNIERDKRQRKALVDADWKVLTVWESDINRKRTRDSALANIMRFLSTTPLPKP